MTFQKDFKAADGELRSTLRDRRLNRPFYPSSYLPLGEWFLPRLEESYGTAVVDAVWETRGEDYDYNPKARWMCFVQDKVRDWTANDGGLTNAACDVIEAASSMAKPPCREDYFSQNSALSTAARFWDEFIAHKASPTVKTALIFFEDELGKANPAVKLAVLRLMRLYKEKRYD